MQRQVSREVAEHALSAHVATTGDDLTPYRIVRIRGSLPSRDNAFIDMGIVRDEMQMRAGRMVTVNRAFRLQQWLAAEAFIASRWPTHQSMTVAGEMLSGLQVDGIRSHAAGRRVRR